ncbi:MAG: amidohydrolase family protein [Pseudomonadota bacterium]|nr:amidohydrolase family protein [Pseudomonadota bacterium]
MGHYNLLALASAVVFFAAQPVSAQPAGDLVIRNIAVVDPVDGMRTGQDVRIRGDRIIEVRPTQPDWPVGTVDGTGKYLIPGLWDMHGHVSDEASGPLYVLNGVTGVRQMMGHSASFAWRHKGLEASPSMPRMYLGSTLIDGSPAHVPGSIEVTSPEDARKAVRIVDRSGAEFLKVYSKLSAESYQALIEEAARLSVRVEGHVPDSVSWLQVAKDGRQRSIEHLWGLPRWVADNASELSARTAKFYEQVAWGGTLTPEQQARSIALQNEAYDHYDPVGFAALVRDLAANRVWQSPTLIVWEARIREANPDNANDPRLAYLPGWMRDFWKGKVAVDGNDKAEAQALSKRRHQYNMDRLREMHAGGVPILAGSDSPLPYILPGWYLHEELALFVEAGLSPIEALRTATSNAGIFLGRTDIGRIRQGALADMVILTANPLQDIISTRQIDSIVINGRLIDARARAAGFERAKSIAAASSVAGPMIAAFKRGGLDAALPVYGQHCPAPPDRMDCTGINAVEFGLAPLLWESPEKSRMKELVIWAERTFDHQADVQVWAGLQHGKSGDEAASLRALEKALALAPGDPFILHHLDGVRR